jgi:hypothetical protein
MNSHALFGILFALFWIGSSIAGAIKKQQQRNNRPPITPREAPAAPSQRRPTLRPRIKPSPTISSRRGPRVVFSPPVAAPSGASQRIAAVPPPVELASPVPVLTERAQPPLAAPIHRWLTPDKLRSQYILTEIFQPPLALRAEW